MVVAGSVMASSVDAATDCAESDDEERRQACKRRAYLPVVPDESWPTAGGGTAADGRDTNALEHVMHNNNNAIDLEG